MRTFFILFCFQLFFLTENNFLLAQNSSSLNLKESKLEFPSEKVFLHYNSTLLFTGEYLYYSAYCISNENNHPSKLSKVGYIELVGKDGTSIFKHKIKLDNGKGQGDFFIPVNIPSGSYKLFAYTEYMKNWGQDNFFQDNLIIINPYTNNQESLLNKSADSVVNRKPILKLQKKNQGFVFTLNALEFDRREKVKIEIKRNEKLSSEGIFSISVRKREAINSPKRIEIDKFLENTKANNFALRIEDSVKHLPEIRGELIKGQVFNKESGKIVANLKLAASIPGKNYFNKIVTTRSDGHFFLNVDKNYDGDEIIFSGLNNENIQVKLEEQSEINIENVEFYDFFLDASMKKSILNRSIYNQIENNYFSFKPDSIRTLSKSFPFYGSIATNYLLDDYLRFPTFEETVVEVLKNVSLKRIGNGEKRIEINSNLPNNEQSGFLPLILVNGLLVNDHKKLLEFDARKIEKLGVVQDKYILNGQIFQGIIDIITFNNEHELFQNFSKENIFTLFKPLSKKYYFKQKYTSLKIDTMNSRIPDFRNQLLWNPDVKLKEKTTSIEFFTSDILGEYEICFQGVTLDGKPILFKESILVKDKN